MVVYFSILYCRYQAGIVTDEMLSLPKIPFLAVGLLEALGAASGMAAGGIYKSLLLHFFLFCLIKKLKTFLLDIGNLVTKSMLISCYYQLTETCYKFVIHVIK